jgi:hypothetical protein
MFPPFHLKLVCPKGIFLKNNKVSLTWIFKVYPVQAEIIITLIHKLIDPRYIYTYQLPYYL